MPISWLITKACDDFLCVREKKEKREFNVPGTKVQEHGDLIAEYQRHRL